MKLVEALQLLPPDMRMMSHLDRTVKSVLEWIDECKSDPSDSYEVGEIAFNYGKIKERTIYCPGIGLIFSEHREIVL